MATIDAGRTQTRLDIAPAPNGGTELLVDGSADEIVTLEADAKLDAAAGWAPVHARVGGISGAAAAVSP